MKLSEQLQRIRRLVRDPSGTVFSNDFLVTCYADEHSALSSILGAGENISGVRTHPGYDASFIQEWERYYSLPFGDTLYQAGIWVDGAEAAAMHIWEVETLAGASEINNSPGAFYIHPFEAWMTETCYYPPPIPMPDDCDEIIGLYWDQEEVEPTSYKSVNEYAAGDWGQCGDRPRWFWYDQTIENCIRIWPLPTLTWADDADAIGIPSNADYADDDSRRIKIGDLYATFEGIFLTLGANVGVVPAEGNIVVIYRTRPAEIDSTDDESNLPSWMQKYVEYGAAEKALRANTDGQLHSLSDYWALRRQAGIEAIKKFRILRLTDRAVRLRPASSPGRRERMARLPDSYPRL